MSIYLNGTKIPGYEQIVSMRLTLAGEDMSGNSSITQRAETGDKPKQLSVTTLIRFEDAKDLAKIIRLAEAKTGVRERVIYNIQNETAAACNLRQVRFEGDVQVREETDIYAWTVSFDLIEYRSVPEKKEDRAPISKTGVQFGAGDVVVPNTTPAQQTAGEANLTDFEKVLAKVNDILK